MAQKKVLIVDDEIDIRETLEELLEDEGYETVAVSSVEEAVQVPLSTIDTALVDIKIGKGDGIELLRQFKEERPIMPVIMITGHGSVSLAAEAFKIGAYEFLEKPLRLMQVRTAVRNSIESLTLKSQIEESGGRTPALYRSETMKRLFSQVSRLAQVNVPVVINGPSGAGKELVAEALHYDGNRRDKPFIAVNAASLPTTLAEDELFGHVKGAFTGADKARKGALEKAHEGTLFLDEVADLDLQVQAKLLRVLESGRFAPLGSEKEILVDVRIIAATHKDMDKLISEGTFRHDLWYRLATFLLIVPSLSERIEDIPLLADTFLEAISLEMGEKRVFDAAARESLLKYSFPGNVRELKNIITRAAVLSIGGTIDKMAIEMAINPTMQNSPVSSSGVDYSHLDYKAARRQFEVDYFSAVLKQSDGNITAAAAAIGMAQSNLSRKLKELGIR